MNNIELAIIGGGASGFFAAANIASLDPGRNINITIFEALKSPMLKLLATGGGRCNLTNNISDIKTFAAQYPRGEKFLYSVFSRFSSVDTISWFEKHGLKTYTDDINCVFPVSDSAKTVSDVLLKLARVSNIKELYNTPIERIMFENNQFVVEAGGKLKKFDTILCCTGGNLGINPDSKPYLAYSLLKYLDIKIESPSPALTSMKVKDPAFSTLAGIVLKETRVVATINNKKSVEYKDDLLFTHKGVSGPVILNLSSLLARFDRKPDDLLQLHINLTGFKDIESLDKHILKLFEENRHKQVVNVIDKFAPKNLCRFILTENNLDPEKGVSSITKGERRTIVQSLFDFTIPVASIDKKAAMATAGGVCLKEINSKTFESKKYPGLYFAGEVVDVDGFCGGFNLQFAWSSGYIAACSIIDKFLPS
jgi:predicted Rossmann fold flavoprotein